MKSRYISFIPHSVKNCPSEKVWVNRQNLCLAFCLPYLNGDSKSSRPDFISTYAKGSTKLKFNSLSLSGYLSVRFFTWKKCTKFQKTLFYTCDTKVKCFYDHLVVTREAVSTLIAFTLKLSLKFAAVAAQGFFRI